MSLFSGTPCWAWKMNNVADALSRNPFAKEIPIDGDADWEDKVFFVDLANDKSFKRDSQNTDPLSKRVKHAAQSNTVVKDIRYKRVRKQLRIESGILMKSGRWVIPPSLRKFVIEKMHILKQINLTILSERYSWGTRLLRECKIWYKLNKKNTRVFFWLFDC